MMNNEIKEILECMEEIADCTFTTDTFELNFEDTKILLDYITNLQQENERLKQIINKVIKDINSYLDGRKIINDNIKYYYTNEFYKKPIKSNIAYLFNDYLEYIINILQNGSEK